METTKQDGAAALREIIEKRGLSAPRLSKATGGSVSATTIRAWLSGTTTPQAGKAREAALALGDPDGPAFLEAFGLDTLAVGVREELAGASARMEFPPAPPTGPAIQPPPLAAELHDPAAQPRPRPIGSRVTLTIILAAHTTGGGRVSVAADEDGALSLVIPLASVEGLG